MTHTPFSPNGILPWGRTLAEYQAMFNLSATDQRRWILDCGGGPASFNAELTALGGHVVSIDPLYALPGTVIEQRVKETLPVVMADLARKRDNLVWTQVQSIAALKQRRMEALEQFLQDYPVGMDEGRYKNASLPTLPLAEGSFDLALCSHLLFFYSEQLDPAFHLDALREMLRVATEVRVFPLLQMDGTPSPHLQITIEAMASHGVEATVQLVPYEFQRGGNRMLCLRNLNRPSTSFRSTSGR